MKRSMPILALVSLQPEEDSNLLPLGAACIAAGLVQAKLLSREKINLITSPVDENPELLVSRILDGQPDIVGFSLYCWNSKVSIALATAIKAEHPDIVLVAGGPDCENVDKNDPAMPFDALFLGEAEADFAAWFRTRWGASTGETAGALSAPHPPLPLPSPWMEGILVPKRDAALAWELTRGCPFRCTYCYEGRGTRGLRHLPDARIAAELELFVRSGVSEVFVLDPTFNVDKVRALSLLRLFAQKGGDIAWNFEIRAELLDTDQAKAFAKLNCSLQIGLQSAFPEVLKKVGRDIDRKKFASKIGLLNAAGAAFGFDLIYGLPGDRLSGFCESLDFALSLSPNHLDIFPLAVLPGTILRAQAAEFSLDFDREPPYLLREHPGFPAADMEVAAGLAESASMFYTRGRAVPWFLSILKPLRIKPSAFLLEFRSGFDSREGSRPLNHRELEALQCTHVSRLYEKRGKSALIPAALDLVRYHGAWSRAFAEGEKSTLRLSYPLVKVESMDILNLEEFCRKNRLEPCSAEIRPTPQGPMARILRFFA